ncbi:aminoacyl tRNA synthase complex-interacting multifunctional protein 1-like [Diaphorina citri]|uniref:Aminoacyl tRNA synthase complex-interacting multifunctional protein 1-like n=1 Tax=Diaphorina citri TaxID=121845 RepID=A0A1S4ESA8_DIACI|nr:aminoacyl tRNA synthase complex-interacting multifunctional protein 1-like [Diaphorina citri]
MLIFIGNVLSLCFLSVAYANFTSPAKSPKSTPNVTRKEIELHRLDLRVGIITHVYIHPNSSHLFCETVDVGEGQDRLIVSGLANYMTAFQLYNTSVVVVCNLKPAKFRGILSQGMILCASETYNNVTRVEVVRPPENCTAGQRVFIHNRTGIPDKMLHPKEMVWPKIQVDLKSDDNGHIRWKGHRLETVNGPLKVYMLHNAPIY